MASGSSLRFSIEVAADQADRSLRALTAAFNETGAQAKIAMSQVGDSSRSAGAEVITLGNRLRDVKSEMVSSQRTANALARGFNDIAPATSAAGEGIRLLISGLVGGAGLGLAIEATAFAIKLMSDAWREAAKEAAKFSKDASDAIDKLQKQLTDLQVTTGAGKAQYEWSNLALQADARRTWIADLEEANRIAKEEMGTDWFKVEANEKLIEQYKDEITQLERRMALLQQIGRQELLNADQKDADREARRVGRPLQTEISASEAARHRYTYGMEPGEAQMTRIRYLPLDDTLKVSAKDLAKGQAEYNREMERSVELSNRWGEALGTVLAQMITGKATVAQAVTGILSAMVKEATAYAVAASVAGAKSQAPIPIIGPGLAIATAGTLLAELLAIVGTMPRAAGGPVLSGMPYLVGELGPELFVPSSSGGIVPNHRIGAGGITLNVAGLIDSGTLERTITANDSAYARAQRKLQRQRRI